MNDEVLRQIEDEMTPLERIELKLDALLAMDVGATLTYKRALREVSLRAARGEESRP